jgi:nucleoside-diphosphate-sugar epimerase
MQKKDLNNKTIFVTGSAGFIGSNLVLRLFKEMSEGTIVGLDNLNDYYDPTLKDYRLSVIEKAKYLQRKDFIRHFIDKSYELISGSS